MRSVSRAESGFTRAVESVRGARLRPEFRLDETPAPQRLSPFALALSAEPVDDLPLAEGRFVLLHDPDGVEEWGGTYRAVVFARASLEPDLLADPMIHEVGWSWLLESLEVSGAVAHELGGTVTRTSGQSFGTMADRPADGHIEIRASWTPAEPSVESTMVRHVNAWGAMLSICSGLAPLPEGVTAVRPARSRM